MDLGELFDRHWPRVWRAAYAVAGDRELANDAAQDAFLRAAQAIHRLESERVEGWLVRVAINRAIDLVRARRRERPEELAGERGAPGPAPPDEVLHEALGLLAPERRAVIALHYWLDYTTPEIADALGIPVGTVNSRLARALRDLRLTLEARNVR